MKRKLSVAARRAARHRVPPRVTARRGRNTASLDARDDLLAHWTAMQQAMVATGADRR